MIRQGSSSFSANVIRMSAEDGYTISKRSHLCMTIYNVSTAGIIFSHKLVCLINSIVGLYFLIRLIFVQPAVSVLFVILAFDAITFYTVMWDNASLIPLMIGILKAETDVVALGSIMNRVFYRSVSRSIPCVGVRVGGFRNMERDSTLIFVDFVLHNVVSLLIAVKH